MSMPSFNFWRRVQKKLVSLNSTVEVVCGDLFITIEGFVCIV